MPSISMNHRRRCDATLELRLSTISECSEDTIFDGEEIDVYALGRKNAPRQSQQKHVAFSPKVSNHIVKRISEKDHPKVWYSSDELCDIRRECAFTISCLSLDNMSCLLEAKQGELSGRGLEKMTPSAAKRRERQRLESLNAVLDEQWDQWYGYEDEELAQAIADSYSRTTVVATRIARIWGIKDAYDAEIPDSLPNKFNK